MSKIISRLNQAKQWKMWGGQDTLLLIQYFSQAHAELSKTSDVWNLAFISNLTPQFNERFQPTNSQECLKQWFCLLPTPITCILLLPSPVQAQMFMWQEFWEVIPLAATWVISLCMNAHAYTRGRSTVVVRTSSCGWGKVFSSLALLLNALSKLQVQLQFWMPNITFRKTQLMGKEKLVWRTEIHRKTDANFSVSWFWVRVPHTQMQALRIG